MVVGLAGLRFAIPFAKLQLTAVVLRSPTTTNVTFPELCMMQFLVFFACCKFVLSFQPI